MEGKERIKKISSSVCFLLLCLLVFVMLTNIMRNSGADRERITGIKSEKDVDVLYIGGSSAFTYWQPLLAYSDYGFTSYVFGADALQQDGTEYLIAEALKYQDPKLIVIDARPFYKWSDSFYEAALRNAADSMDIFSLNRIRYIRNYFENHDSEGYDILDFCFDISKYHSRYSGLFDKASIGYAFNSGSSEDKGFQWVEAYDMRVRRDNRTDAAADIDPKSEEQLENLMDYLDDADIPVLFVISPKDCGKEEQMRYNRIGELVRERGYDFLNANCFYDDMGFDFSMDFYNHAHVNIFGAEKYTRWLGEYISRAYGLEDRKGDPALAEWDAGAERTIALADACKEAVLRLREEYDRHLELEKTIPELSPEEVSELISGDSLLVPIVFGENETYRTGTIPRPQNIEASYVLERSSEGVVLTVFDALSDYDSGQKYIRSGGACTFIYDICLGRIIL